MNLIEKIEASPLKEGKIIRALKCLRNFVVACGWLDVALQNAH
jgi:hypothetical protein